ncbi:hypothetical protein E4U14_005057 [Claviceps sp. LM454 group G7]|nr:hypothetical protein E4U14_005057 [Claviceps sp. LM454 group G7]
MEFYGHKSLGSAASLTAAGTRNQRMPWSATGHISDYCETQHVIIDSSMIKLGLLWVSGSYQLPSRCEGGVSALRGTRRKQERFQVSTRWLATKSEPGDDLLRWILYEKHFRGYRYSVQLGSGIALL